MNTECERIADQVRRAFAGEAWHGPPIRDALAGVSAQQALARPLASAHCIWDLVIHIQIWADIAEQAIHGAPMPRLYGTEKDWPAAHQGGESEWALANERLLACGQRFAASIEQFSDSRLSDAVPGRDYNFYHLFHGVVQHSLYHAGQIAMLKRVAAA
jgi:hypothetical protein